MICAGFTRARVYHVAAGLRAHACMRPCMQVSLARQMQAPGSSLKALSRISSNSRCMDRNILAKQVSASKTSLLAEASAKESACITCLSWNGLHVLRLMQLILRVAACAFGKQA
jgi:hypothetical protein